MPIIVLTTAAGAPGASTTALGLTLSWPGPALLVEADPAGTSLVPGWFRGGIDPHQRNIVNIALVETAEALTEAIFDQAVSIGTDDDEHERLALLGLTEPVQAPALENWWGPIGTSFQTLSAAGYAVIIDAGRLTQGSYPTPLLAVADQILLVCRATLTSILRTYPMAAQLRTALTPTGNADALGIVAIGNDGHRYYPAPEIAKHLGARFALSIPDDPFAAAALSDGQALPPRLTDRLKARFTRRQPTGGHATAGHPTDDAGTDQEGTGEQDPRDPAETVDHIAPTQPPATDQNAGQDVAESKPSYTPKTAQFSSRPDSCGPTVQPPATAPTAPNTSWARCSPRSRDDRPSPSHLHSAKDIPMTPAAPQPEAPRPSLDSVRSLRAVTVTSAPAPISDSSRNRPPFHEPRDSSAPNHDRSTSPTSTGRWSTGSATPSPKDCPTKPARCWPTARSTKPPGSRSAAT